MASPINHINPEYRKQVSKAYTPQECIDGLGKDMKVLSYLISKSESILYPDKIFLDKVLSQVNPSKAARKIAITGSPGVGKSTFLNSFCNHLLESGYRVAILPVDPSSHASKGSILGDKTRMDDLVGKENIYIKPTASNLALGGVAPSTRTSIDLCEIAGYDYIFIETVGVGQSEYEVRHLVDMFLLLLQPGGGDELQGIKRGIIEMADLLIVTKSDGALSLAADQSLRGYKNALQLLWPNDYKWKAKARPYSSVTHAYREELQQQINAYYTHMAQQDRLAQLRASQALHYFHAGTTQVLLNHLLAQGHLNEEINSIEKELKEGRIFPFQALLRLEQKLNEK